MLSRFYKRILLLLIVCSGQTVAQYKDSVLCKPGTVLFNGSIYVFGFDEQSGLKIAVKRLSATLQTTKEYVYEISGNKCKDYYGLQADTIHGYLNLTLQQINNDKTCRIIRLDKNLKLIADIKDAEVTRVNTFTAYDNEICYFKKYLYVVRPFAKDSANHFFLQKYTLKDSSKVFEYETGWQLNFSKQKYHRCHIIMANKQYVYLYTNVLEGSKEGQWLILIDTERGEILHSERLNNENEGNVFLYGAHCYNKQTKALSIVGYKLPKKNVHTDYTMIDFSLMKSKTAPLFVCTFDSTGKITERLHNFVAVPSDLEREKEFKQFVFKVSKFSYANNQYHILTEVIAGVSTHKAYKTYGFNFTLVEPDEEGVLKPKFNSFICTYRDSKNKNAKLIFNLHEMDHKHNAEEVLYKPSVTAAFKDVLWDLSFGAEKIITYSAFKTKTQSTFYKYYFIENKWQIAEVQSIPQSEVFNSYLLNAESFLVFKNISFDPENKTASGLEGSIIKEVAASDKK